VKEGDKPKEKDASRRRRGRGRKGKREADGGEEAEKEVTVAETILAEPEVTVDDGDEEDVSGWEVPSWHDLIEALYRPDAEPCLGETLMSIARFSPFGLRSEEAGSCTHIFIGCTKVFDPWPTH